MNAYTKIRKAMRANERATLASIKRTVKEEGAYNWTSGLTSRSRHNAIDRIEANGLIRYVSGKGYVVTAKGKKSR